MEEDSGNNAASESQRASSGLRWDQVPPWFVPEKAVRSGPLLTCIPPRLRAPRRGEHVSKTDSTLVCAAVSIRRTPSKQDVRLMAAVRSHACVQRGRGAKYNHLRGAHLWPLSALQCQHRAPGSLVCTSLSAPRQLAVAGPHHESHGSSERPRNKRSLRSDQCQRRAFTTPAKYLIGTNAHSLSDSDAEDAEMLKVRRATLNLTS
ncbi:unnamed protein product [Arctogadus glacialis]